MLRVLTDDGSMLEAREECNSQCLFIKRDKYD